MIPQKSIVVFVFFILCIISSAHSQDMQPPKPLDNKVYEAMVGQWTGESDMMGTKMKQDVSIKWAINHQFIIMDVMVTGKDNPDMKYSGMGIYGVDEKGNVKSWWFDDWGASAMTTGSGTFGDNRVDMTDGNSMYKETRSIEVNGNQMTMHAKGSMTMNGKDMPFEENIIYTKQ